MMGKLIGGVCTSLTLGMVYLFGAAMVSWKLQVLDQVSVVQMIGFVGLTIIASFMYGSLFVIAGAGASNLKEAQALMMPVMLIVVLPMFLVGSLIEDPSRVGGSTRDVFSVEWSVGDDVSVIGLARAWRLGSDGVGVGKFDYDDGTGLDSGSSLSDGFFC
ncbi:MAG: hypothetical protein KatS3mg104_2568 [Phycisphaerae bacterium]|nr:MAG: hypothetical protein KatS3mg104_2568 [Phycisphaerae bacterium]